MGCFVALWVIDVDQKPPRPAQETSIDLCFRLKQDVGSHALMGDTGFEQMDFLQATMGRWFQFPISSQGVQWSFRSRNGKLPARQSPFSDDLLGLRLLVLRCHAISKGKEPPFLSVVSWSPHFWCQHVPTEAWHGATGRRCVQACKFAEGDSRILM